MAKIPKSESAIKTVIAGLVTDNTDMTKKEANIRLKSKSFEYVKAGDGTNLAIRKENLVFWLMVTGKPDTDYTALETAINTATDTSFNSLEIMTVRESAPMNEYVRYYEIKVT